MISLPSSASAAITRASTSSALVIATPVPKWSPTFSESQVVEDSIYKTKFHWKKGGPLILKGGARLEMWFIVQTFCSLAKHWDKGAFLFEKEPHSA